MQRGVDQLRDPLIVDSARRAGANVIVQTGDAPLDKTRAPLSDRGLGQPQSLGDRIVQLALGATEKMRARLLSAAGNERLRANDCNCDRSSSLKTNSNFGLPVLIAVSPFQRYRTGMQD
jgi:hypothetical protein